MMVRVVVAHKSLQQCKGKTEGCGSHFGRRQAQHSIAPTAHRLQHRLAPGPDCSLGAAPCAVALNMGMRCVLPACSLSGLQQCASSQHMAECWFDLAVHKLMAQGSVIRC